jgi:hypothetical protein
MTEQAEDSSQRLTLAIEIYIIRAMRRREHRNDGIATMLLLPAVLENATLPKFTLRQRKLAREGSTTTDIQLI